VSELGQHLGPGDVALRPLHGLFRGQPEQAAVGDPPLAGPIRVGGEAGADGSDQE
jgi:hypothetical protein